MNAHTGPAAGRGARALRSLRHPLVLFALIEFAVLAGTVVLILTRHG